MTSLDLLKDFMVITPLIKAEVIALLEIQDMDTPGYGVFQDSHGNRTYLEKVLYTLGVFLSIPHQWLEISLKSLFLLN